jgi:outer membrane receptor for ferrienterochelin and colicin
MNVRLISLSISLLLFFNNSVYGQIDSSLTNLSLEDLLRVKVTTASKTLQEQDLAPAKVIVVSKEQIRARNYQSLLDLIIDLPGVKVDDKIYTDSRNSVVIRGIQGQQNFFILLNGVKISSPTNESLPIMENYPLHLAEQVEIVYGPSSALYGADAVAGVVNIITRQLPSGKTSIVVDASSAVGMYGYTNTTLYMSKSFGEKMGIVLSGQYYYDQQPDLSQVYKEDTLLSVGHYGTGSFNSIFGTMTPVKPVTPRYEAPTGAYNIYAALHLNNFTFSYFSNYTRTPTAWGNNTHNAIYNKEVYMGQGISTITGTYRKVIGRITSTSTLMTSTYSMDPESNYRNLYTGMEPVYKFAATRAAKAEQQVDYKFSEKLNLTAGLTHEYFNTIPQSPDLEKPVNPAANIQGTYAGTTSYYTPQGIPAQLYHVVYENSGAYLQAQYAMSRKISFTLGARYDYNSRYKETFNPRLGLVYKASSRTTIKALYGSAFLAPPPTTAYVAYGSFITQDSGKTYMSDFLHLPNPDLKPIRSQHLEISARHYLNNNLAVTVDAFYTVLSGLFTYADDNTSTKLYNNMFLNIPVNYIEVFVNEGKQQNYGASMQVNFKHYIGSVFFNTYGSATYTGGERYDFPNATADYHAQLPFISSFMGRIGTDARVKKLTFSPRLTVMGRQNLPGVKDTVGTSIRVQTLAGYALLNFAVRYDVSKRFSVFANVTNALDRRYRGVGYNMDLKKTNTELLHGQPQDPIRFMGGLSLSLAN